MLEKYNMLLSAVIFLFRSRPTYLKKGDTAQPRVIRLSMQMDIHDLQIAPFLPEQF